MTLPEPKLSPAGNDNAAAKPPLALKLLVYGMGVLLVAGIVGFAGALWWKFGSGKEASALPPYGAAVTGEAVTLPAFGTRVLPIPAGSRILETALDGSTLVLRLERVEAGRPSPGRVEMLWFYDVTQERVIGTYEVRSGE